MSTKKDREGYRLYRLAGGLLEMYEGAEELERAKEAAREKACRGIEGKKLKDVVGSAIEKNIINRAKWDYESLTRAYELPISERDFCRRKRVYAEELVRKLGVIVGKNCDTI